MNPRDYVTKGGLGRRPENSQPELRAAIALEEALADHHIEEVLAALNGLRTAEGPEMAMSRTADQQTAAERGS